MTRSIKTRKLPFRTALAVVLGVFAGLLPARAQESSYAEKLGFKSDEIVLIMHVDDMGMSFSANRGASDSLERGIANSVGIMMPCPWVTHAQHYMTDHPNLDAGLQITLTSEFDYYRWPSVAGISAVPSLADLDGCLWRTVPLVLTNGVPEQVEEEIRAQIQRAERMKLSFTHVDSHLNLLFRRKDFLERYVKVAIEKQVPMVVAGGHLTNAKLEDPALANIMKEVAPKMWSAGLPVLDDIVDKADEWEPSQKKQKLLGLLYRIKPGITQMNFRPAVPSDEMRLFTRTDRSRMADSAALTDSEARRVIENRGIILTTWRELMARRKKTTSGPL